MLGLLGFILVFALLVVVHEFGHYYVAKKSGVLVREFAIGFGPKIFSHHSDETTYTVRMIPAGGYVRLAGGYDEVDLEKGMSVILHTDASGLVQVIDTANQENQSDGLPLEVTEFDLEDAMFIEGYVPGQDGKQIFSVSRTAEIIEMDGTNIQVAPRDRQLQSAKTWQQILINAAGPLMNVILAIALFTAFSFIQGGAPTTEPVIGAVQSESVAAEAGLEPGDIIQRVDGKEMSTYLDVIETISNTSGPVELQIEKASGQEETVTLEPEQTLDEATGQTVSRIGVAFPGKDTSFTAKLFSGFTQTFSLIAALLQAIWNLILNFDINQLGGPVAMFATTSQAVQRGLSDVVYLAAYLSVNLAIINLLPIPALDGGKIVLNIIEGIMGRPVSEKFVTTLTLIGVAFLFVLMISVFIKDINVFLIN